MHWIDAGILFLILLAMVTLLLVLLHRTRLGSLVHEHIADRPRRRLFLASLSFFLTFAIVRGMVYCIRHRIPPFHYIIMGGRLCEFGTGSDSSSIFASRCMSILYGVGAALTLDEFALWLNLKDVYFVREGRSSIDAVILFGSLLAIGGWGAPLFAALAKRKTKENR
jgi:hypothetical protein